MIETSRSTETARVYALFRERLLAFVRRRVASDQDAEDLVQEVFARMHADGGVRAEVDSVSGWVFQITRNVIADYHRARASAGRMSSALAREPLAVLAQEVGGDTATEARAELARCLRLFVGRLPQPYAEALELTDLGTLSQTAAARRLGLSVSGMKSRVQRGRMELRRRLLACCDVEQDARRRAVDIVPRGDGCQCPS